MELVAVVQAALEVQVLMVLNEFISSIQILFYAKFLIRGIFLIEFKPFLSLLLSVPFLFLFVQFLHEIY
jgi:hypothetical protein